MLSCVISISLAHSPIPPRSVNFRQMNRARYSIYNLTDLTNADLGQRLVAPSLASSTNGSQWTPSLTTLIASGISIVYDHQLIHAFYLAQALKKRWPNKLLLIGGTSISQLYKHMRDKTQMKRFFDLCDAIVVGEGETAICEIAAVEGDSARTSHTHLITYDRQCDEVRLPQESITRGSLL